MSCLRMTENFMMHILEEDVGAWWRPVQASGIVSTFCVGLTPIDAQPWKLRDFCLVGPSGVLWRIGQNTV